MPMKTPLRVLAFAGLCLVLFPGATLRGADRGADAAVAAGPVGRQAEADTDVRLKAEIFSYSRSRGLFAGVSLEGAILRPEHAATTAYYRREVTHWLDPRTGKMVPLTPPSVK